MMNSGSPTKSLIQTARQEDLADIMGLVNQEEWSGYHFKDLELALRISPESCFVIRQEKVVASCFSLVLNEVAYISYLLVKKEYRNNDYGVVLGNHCLKEAIRKARTVIIYANKKLVKHYTRYGFNHLYEVKRFVLKATLEMPEIDCIRLSVKNFALIRPLLKKIYANDRTKIFRELLQLTDFRIYVSLLEKEVRTLIGVFELDEKTVRIGPLLTDHEKTAALLLEKVVGQYRGKKVFCEAGTEKLKRFIKTTSLEQEEERVTVDKMFLGDLHLLENSACLLIEGGHHFS